MDTHKRAKNGRNIFTDQKEYILHDAHKGLLDCSTPSPIISINVFLAYTDMLTFSHTFCFGSLLLLSSVWYHFPSIIYIIFYLYKMFLG
jgi:hypothetical protein